MSSSDAGSADLFSVAEAFLSRLNARAEARPFLAAYDMRVQFDVTDGEPFHAVIAGGRVERVVPGRVEQFSTRDAFELFGGEAGFRLVFAGLLTPSAAMYYG